MNNILNKEIAKSLLVQFTSKRSLPNVSYIIKSDVCYEDSLTFPGVKEVDGKLKFTSLATINILSVLFKHEADYIVGENIPLDSVKYLFSELANSCEDENLKRVLEEVSVLVNNTIINTQLSNLVKEAHGNTSMIELIKYKKDNIGKFNNVKRSSRF